MSVDNNVGKLKPHNQISLNRAVIKVGTKWCKACRDSREDYEEIATKYSKVTFYELDADRFEKDKSMMKEINDIVKKTSALPTFYFFRKGKVIAKVEGLKKSKFELALAELE